MVTMMRAARPGLIWMLRKKTEEVTEVTALLEELEKLAVEIRESKDDKVEAAAKFTEFKGVHICIEKGHRN